MVRFKSRVVTEGNIADNSVTAAKILDGTITNAKMDVDEGHNIDVKRKAANEAVNNSTAMQNDNDLVSASLAASTVWVVDLIIVATNAGGVTGDANFDFTIPTGATLYVGGTYLDTADALAVPTSVGNQNTIGVGMTSVDRVFRIAGWIEISTTAGTCQLRWAQNVATVGDLTFRKNSSMLLRRVA